MALRKKERGKKGGEEKEEKEGKRRKRGGKERRKKEEKEKEKERKSRLRRGLLCYCECTKWIQDGTGVGRVDFFFFFAFIHFLFIIGRFLNGLGWRVQGTNCRAIVE